MGGGGFQNIDWSNLRKVHFSISYSANGNNDLFDYEKIYRGFTSESLSYLKELGVNVEEEVIGGRGGGGMEGFLDTLKWLWENREVIQMFFLIVNALFKLMRTAYYNTTLSIVDTKPRVQIFMKIKLEGEFTTYGKIPGLNLALHKSLFALKHVADNLCTYMSTKYPVFAFDQCLEAQIGPKDFSVTYNTPFEKQSNFNKLRMLRLINALRVKNHMSQNYKFTNLFIKRTDSIKMYKHGKFDDFKNKIYYLFLSSTILFD